MARGQISRDVHLPGRTQAPDGWQMVHLGDVTAAQQGGTPPKSRAEYWDGDIPFVTGADLSEFSVSRDNARSFLTVEGLNSGATVICEPGALLLATRTRVGLVSIAGETMGASQDITLLTPNDLVEPSYLCRTLMSQTALLQRRARGTTIQGVSRGEVDSLPVLLPPPAEQRAIAEALSDVDGLLGDLEALIAKKRAIKQAAMQQLLTGKTRLPGFTGVWRTKRLGELGTFSKGRGVKREDVSNEGLPSVLYGELYTKYDNYVFELSSRIPRKVAQMALPIEAGDLLFAGSGETAEEIGRCAVYLGNESAYAGGDIIVLRSSGQDPIYLGHLFNHPTVQAQKARMGQGNAVVHISTHNLAQVQISLPPAKEQSAIAAVLLDMNSEIAALERRRNKTRAIKQGMMHELLTGRVRLIPPNGAAEASSC